jgi:hypothetical protein
MVSTNAHAYAGDHADSYSESRANRDVDSLANQYTYSFAHPDRDADPDGHTDAHRGADGYVNANERADEHAVESRDEYPYGRRDGDTN